MLQQDDLRKRRLIADITQVELAQKAGCDRTRLSLAERGYVRLKRSELEAIDAVLCQILARRLKELQAAMSDTV